MDDAHLLQYCWCMKVSLEQIAYIRPIKLAAHGPHAAKTWHRRCSGHDSKTFRSLQDAT